MKKIQVPFILLGLFNLLVPVGVGAQYALAAKGEPVPVPGFPQMAVGFIFLIFGSSFIYLGIRLLHILYATPRMPILTLRAWVVADIAASGIFGRGHGPNPIALVFMAGVYWYFSWALKREIGADA